MTIPEDPFIRELLPEFIESWLDDIRTKYRLFIIEKDSAELYRLAHTLKGSCYQFGLTDLGDTGIKIMALAKEGKWEEALSYEEYLMKSFLEIKEFIESHTL